VKASAERSSHPDGRVRTCRTRERRLLVQEGNEMSATNTIEMASLKDKLKGTWMAGNYDYFSRFM